MEKQGCTWSWWMAMAVTFMMLMTTVQAMLPDFMFGWSAEETRTQAGRPQSRIPSGLPHEPTKRNSTSKMLLHDLIYQGDIKLREEEAREILDAVSNRRRRRRKRKITAYRDKWWKLPIPYIFDENLRFNVTEKRYILSAIRHWEERTCITFTEVPPNTTLQPVLLFRKEKGCWSYVGREKAFKRQEISIGDDCFNLGIMVHELGHAIGFWHEHSRPDRNEYIRVRYENVESGESLNFERESWRDIDDLNVPYNIGSVMHYSGWAFSRNGGATVETLQPLDQGVLGQRQSLSFYDAKQANLAYCSHTCASSPVKDLCHNEGYPDPNDCSRCRCPDGLTGNTCQMVAPSVGTSCGGEVRILGRESYTIVTPGYPNDYPSNVQCNWLIKASDEKKIIKLAPVRDGFLQPKPYCHEFGGRICDVDYIEIKYRVSMAKTGARFCCGDGPKSVIKSQSNTMMVLLRTRNAGKGGFKFIVSSESCGGCMEATPNNQPACMVQETRWCPKRWTSRHWVTCSGFYNFFDNRCGYYQNRTVYRKGFCLREVGTCCGQFKLSGNRCIRDESLPRAAEPVTGVTTTSPVTSGGDVTDTGWSNWLSWSQCSRSCGGCGTRTRKRTCDSPGSSCSAEKEETQTVPCQDNPCPSPRYLCEKKRVTKEQCSMFTSKLCTRYQTYLGICSNECCTGYSSSNGKCVKDPS